MSILHYLGLLAIWMLAALLAGLLIGEFISQGKGKRHDKQDNTP
jgi:uncharacterized protein YneF (UPF0154 family)